MIDRDLKKLRPLARAGEDALRQRMGVPGKDMDEGADLSLSEAEFTRTLPLIRLLRKLRDSVAGMATAALFAPGGGWDDPASLNWVAEKPVRLRRLLADREEGTFDRVAAEIKRRKALGQLNGAPACHAYREVRGQLGYGDPSPGLEEDDFKIYGALIGTGRVAEGYDLTMPTSSAWYTAQLLS